MMAKLLDLAMESEDPMAIGLRISQRSILQMAVTSPCTLVA